MLRYAITILVSSFLLFQIQPLIAKCILPWFGGSSSVWTTCMLFFQLVLFLGYCYAHLLTSISPKRQLVVHFGLIVAAGFFLPIVPAEWLKPDGAEDLSLGVLFALAATIGLPFFALSTTGPLVQAWHCRTHSEGSSYRLFALSNFGSLVALLSYPFLIEPMMRLQNQLLVWSLGFIVFILFSFSSAWQFAFCQSTTEQMNPSSLPVANARLRLRSCLMWILLSFSASALLLAATNQMCQEVASIPFLWVLPLSLYLLTFIICFDKPQWYKWWLFFPLMIGSTIAVFFILICKINVPLPIQVAGFAMAMFSSCMCCHGELERTKPPTSNLTAFYLMVSGGGALGGIFVGVLAPRMFSSFLEFELSSILTIVAASISFFCFKKSEPIRSGIRKHAYLMIPFAVTAVILMAGYPIIRESNWGSAKVIHASRSPYGLLSVVQFYEDDGAKKHLSLYNGSIKHGGQIDDLSVRDLPTTYYMSGSGVGIALKSLRSQKSVAADNSSPSLKVGVVGLGVGTMSAWAEHEDDEFKFYELDPNVAVFAEKYFTFLNSSISRKNNSVVLGDARLQMENQLRQSGSEQYDLITVDAFSSDAIPLHLLTKECFEIYTKHTRDDGLIAIHISNRFIDLWPVVLGLANEFGWEALQFLDREPAKNGHKSNWVVMTRDRNLAFEMRKHPNFNVGEKVSPVIWTDDFGAISNLIDWSKVWDLKELF